MVVWYGELELKDISQILRSMVKNNIKTEKNLYILKVKYKNQRGKSSCFIMKHKILCIRINTQLEKIYQNHSNESISYILHLFRLSNGRKRSKDLLYLYRG